jgi:SecD/SecF fusion protein
MQDRNLIWKLAFIAVIVLWGVYTVSTTQLKGGIDLVGGHSLLYEIDTTGLKETTDLSARVMDRLKQRVDPQGVRNLVWRPVGNTRLEIQMPLPPKEATELRAAFQSSMDLLKSSNVSVFELERALALNGDKRQGQLETLVRSVSARQAILPELVRAYDAWQKALADKASQDIQEDREAVYESQLDKMLATNINIAELNEALETVPAEREKSLKNILAKYPARKGQIESVVTAYDSWSTVKGPLDDPADLMRLLRGAGVLEFHILASASPDAPEQFTDYIKRLEEKGPRARPDDEYAWYEIAKEDAIGGGIVREWGGKRWVLAYQTNPMRVLDKAKAGWKLADSNPTRDDTGMPAVSFTFNEIGANYFADLTRNNIGKALAIVLDGQAYSAPVIRSTIRERGIITGKFTIEEVNYLVNTLNAGSLDASLKDTPIAVNSIGPSLGLDNRTAGFKASLWGLAVVVVFMLFYYFWAGAIADFALAMNLLLLLAVMVTLQATFTMAGIAGVILSMGMAVDANILIFERMREEQQRLQSLRLIIKNGFDRALPTIVDANMTTIITCVVLFYIGSEEIKGFALTLGLGLLINIFTAFFVTKVVFTLMANHSAFKSLPMLSLIKRPSVNWMSKQKYFWAVSFVFIIIALIAWPMRGEGKYDIEFRGGTSVQIELKSPELMGIEEVRVQVKEAGQTLAGSSVAVQQAQVKQDAQVPSRFMVTFNNISAHRMEAAMMAFMSDDIEKGSLEIASPNTIAFRLKTGEGQKPSVEKVKADLATVAKAVETMGKDLTAAQVQSIGQKGTNFEIVTTATSQQLVTDAVIQKMGGSLNIQQAIGFNPDIKVYPITRKRLGEVIADPKAPGYIPEYLGGVAMVVHDLDPAVTIEELKDRVNTMRLQPDFKAIQWRSQFDVIGLTAMPGQDLSQLSEKETRYNRVAVVVMDPNAVYDEDESIWKSQLAEPELMLLQEAMTRTSGLQRVTQFAPQVAGQTMIAAVLAMIVAFGAIAMYLWIRFGTLRHGIAANIATVHDLLTVLGLVLITAWLADTALGKALMIQDFKLNLTMVAAFLTLIGYSVNDTIIVFDRIRENQGKLKELRPNLINDSINQTLSRTIITSITTLLVMLTLYIFGGDGVHGFSYVMILGILFGSYSSIAIASPLLLGWTGVMGKLGVGEAATKE